MDKDQPGVNREQKKWKNCHVATMFSIRSTFSYLFTSAAFQDLILTPTKRSLYVVVINI